MTIGELRKFVEATNFVTKAEKDGGGLVYELGWTKKIGWNWSSPIGDQSDDAEPLVHVTFDEAQAFSGWNGKCYSLTRNGKCSLVTSFGLCSFTACKEERNIFSQGRKAC